jgi:putative flippase GtrA
MAIVVHYSSLFILVSQGFNPLAATSLGFALAILVNYGSQYYWVFNTSRPHKHVFPSYVGVTVAMMGINASVFWLASTILDWHYLFTQGLATAAVVTLNFRLNHRFTFYVSMIRDGSISKLNS